MKIIFLPGASGDAAFWRPVADHLPGDWNKVLLGWPGLGTQPPSPEVGSFDDLMGLVVAEMDQPLALVAQSMGGVVAMRTALAHRARVTHLVLTATSAGIDMSSFGVADWRPEYRATYPRAQEWVYERVASIDDRLPGLDIPTLLIWATADAISPPGVGRRLAALLPRARLVELEDDSHMFGRDRPQDVAPLIAAHLAKP